MNLETTTGQALESFTGAALLGLGMDQVPCRLADLLYRMLNEAVSSVFWGVLSSLEASAGILSGHLHLLAGPFAVASWLEPLLHLVGRAL